MKNIIQKISILLLLTIFTLSFYSCEEESADTDNPYKLADSPLLKDNGNYSFQKLLENETLNNPSFKERDFENRINEVVGTEYPNIDTLQQQLREALDLSVPKFKNTNNSVLGSETASAFNTIDIQDDLFKFLKSMLKEGSSENSEQSSIESIKFNNGNGFFTKRGYKARLEKIKAKNYELSGDNTLKEDVKKALNLVPLIFINGEDTLLNISNGDSLRIGNMELFQFLKNLVKEDSEDFKQCFFPPNNNPQKTVAENFNNNTKNLIKNISNTTLLIIGMLVGLFLLFLMLYLLLRNFRNDIVKKLKKKESTNQEKPQSQHPKTSDKYNGILNEIKQLRQEIISIQKLMQDMQNEQKEVIIQQEDKPIAVSPEIEVPQEHLKLYYKNAGSGRITDATKKNDVMATWVIEPNATVSSGEYYPAESGKGILLGSVDILLMKNCEVVNNRFDIEIPRNFRVIQKGKVVKEGNAWKIVQQAKIELS